MKGIKRYISLLLYLLLVQFYVQAQISNLDDLTPRQLKKFAQNAERAGDVHTAILFYERYIKYKANDNNVTYLLADLNRKARNYERAKELYEKLSLKVEYKYPLAQFYYAQMLKATGDYDKANEQFNEFRRNYKGYKDSRYFTGLARSEMNGCDSAKLIMQKPLNITIEDLNSSINGPHIEFSPIPMNDTTLLYASLRVDSLVFFTSDNADTARPSRQFYKAHKEGLDWMGGEYFKSPINIEGVETGNGVLSRDGKKFYFTRCFENWQGKNICSIYYSDITANGWSKPEKLPPIINDPNYTSTQPALGRTAGSNSEVLYFVSDRPEGKGGLDIWYSVWNEKKKLYSKPRNLGSKINTKGDDMTPYYNLSTRKLYFSSSGLPGMGGLDIFSALGERKKWSMIRNVGYPLNSSYDDLYFTIGKSGEFGFFSSNRPGKSKLKYQTCCDDIYSYRWNEFIHISVKGTIYPFEKDKYGRKQDLSNFDFMNPDASIKPQKGAIVALYMLDKEENEYIFIDRDTTGVDGVFFFDIQPDEDYEFRMEGFQYFDSKEYLSTEFFNFSDTIGLPPIWVNVLSDKPVVLENIYYDFNSADLSDKAKRAIDTTLLVMLKEAPEFVIEIGAHTDSIGNEVYNKDLSQKRADNVVSYLISKGIATERLVAVGYGAEKPVAANKKPDGSDNPKGREKNRRTEFRIIGSVNAIVEDEEYDN